VFKKSWGYFSEQKQALSSGFQYFFNRKNLFSKTSVYLNTPRTHFGKNIFLHPHIRFVWSALPLRVDLISNHEDGGCFRESKIFPRIGQEGALRKIAAAASENCFFASVLSKGCRRYYFISFC
jgi:hypothetical protein